MAEGRRRRSSDQRNMLYDEPSMWGIGIVLGIVVAAVSLLLIFLFVQS